GPRGFVSSINVDNANGLVTIIGIDALGIAPMVELHLFTITWTAVGLGTSSLDLTIDALSDIESLDIGTPNAIDGSVEVRGPMSAPVLSYPLAFYYRENTIGHSITWIATDDNPTTYTVTRMLYPDNQTLTQVSSGSYSSGSPIIVNVDGLSVGVYQYTCTVNDADGLSNSNIVMVRVIPADLGNVWFSPVSTQTIGDTFETKIYINTGSQNIAAYGFNITYNKDVIQIASDEYVVAGAEGFVSAVNIDNVNGWVMIAGFEAAGTGPNSQLHLITINWTTVGVGTSSLDLSIEDLVDSNKKPIEFSNAIDDSIVVDPKQAPIIDSPQDFSYKAGETGNSITWIATDNNPTTYIITRNDTQVDSDIWSSGNPITINIDGLSPNIYIYTITVYDGDNLIDSDSITVLVYPANEPEGGNIPGYDLFIFLGSMWITILAMIYIKKRR
ncbi:MAG: hypothetical protein JXA99_01485, partial [Candidatus Lokiarchaeota archaeon]|nr:hypothetical protein [Candidatus Lokiarchaeota archaeon]